MRLFDLVQALVQDRHLREAGQPRAKFDLSRLFDCFSVADDQRVAAFHKLSIDRVIGALTHDPGPVPLKGGVKKRAKADSVTMAR
jgi:hypothetical protein